MRAGRYVGTVLLLGGCSALIAGVLALAAGAWMLVEIRSAPELTVAGGQVVTIPQGGFLRDSVPVYADADVDVADLDTDPGCRLTGQAAGDTLRIDDLFFATGEDVTVEGRTWYPLVEVSLADDRPGMECPGLPDSATVAVGEPRTFDSSIGFVTPSVLVAGPLFILLGLGGALVGVLLLRDAPRTASTRWQA